MLKPGLFGGQWEDFINPSDLDGTGAADSVLTNLPAPYTGTDAKPSSSVPDDLLDAGEAIWISPNTALGLIAGIAGIPFGARPTFEYGAVVFNDYPWHGPHAGALTLGNTILSNLSDLNQDGPTYTSNYNAGAGLPTPSNPSVNIGNHEGGHVHQAGALGPLYIPTYVLQSILSNGPSPMEKAADTYGQTGKGWWPW